MKVLRDTNVLIAAFVSRGMCAELVEHCMTEHEVYTSRFVLEEFTRTLRRKFKYPADEVAAAQRVILSEATIVSESVPEDRLCRDKDDNHVLAAAIEARVDCVITGDNDLLVLKQVRDIPIVSPRDFWRYQQRHT
jgi:putative PIN family toxin of toxin-antitoxin system